MTNHQTYEFLRNQIAHEFALLNGRILWFASCQSFLITAFVLSLSSAPLYHSGWLPQFLLPGLGGSLCVTVFPGIVGARNTIKSWMACQYRFLQTPEVRAELGGVIIKRFDVDPRQDQLHRRSLWFSTSLPVLLGLFWVSAFVLIRVLPIHHTV